MDSNNQMVEAGEFLNNIEKQEEEPGIPSDRVTIGRLVELSKEIDSYLNEVRTSFTPLSRVVHNRNLSDLYEGLRNSEAVHQSELYIAYAPKSIEDLVNKIASISKKEIRYNPVSVGDLVTYLILTKQAVETVRESSGEYNINPLEEFSPILSVKKEGENPNSIPQHLEEFLTKVYETLIPERLTGQAGLEEIPVIGYYNAALDSKNTKAVIIFVKDNPQFIGDAYVSFGKLVIGSELVLDDEDILSKLDDYSVVFASELMAHLKKKNPLTLNYFACWRSKKASDLVLMQQDAIVHPSCLAEYTANILLQEEKVPSEIAEIEITRYNDYAPKVYNEVVPRLVNRS